jgi:hypothetical protein
VKDSCEHGKELRVQQNIAKCLNVEETDDFSRREVLSLLLYEHWNNISGHVYFVPDILRLYITDNQKREIMFCLWCFISLFVEGVLSALQLLLSANI